MQFMAKKPAHGRHNDDRIEVGDLVSCRVDSEDLAAALTSFLGDQRPRIKKNSLVLVALEDYLRSRNYYPPSRTGNSK
jgi:hypothetical protein